MGLVQTLAPVKEPVSAADLANYLHIDSDLSDDDALLGVLITAARKYGESLTGRSWITQKWRLQLDGFGDTDECGQIILLDRGQVQSIDSITYLDTSGVQQSLDPTTLAQDLISLPARISPKFGQIWPIAQPQIASVQINYTAGYGDNATDVPAGICEWLMRRAATLYEHRDEVEVVTRGKIEAMPFVDMLLDPYKVLQL
jgi:uncharacterized phiE125 gp8 family phage protein